MGRRDSDPTMVNSSIALLQERFRQLEKVKERREGKKELVRLLSSESSTSSSMQNHASSIQHDTLCLGLNLGAQNTIKMNSPPYSSSSPWPQPQGASTSRNFDSSDVDTSLHL